MENELNLTNLTPDEIYNLMKTLKGMLPKGKPGKKPFLSNEKVIEIYSRAENLKHFGDLLLMENLHGKAEGKTGLEYWGGSEAAVSAMASRVTRLRKEGKVTKFFRRPSGKKPVRRTEKIVNLFDKMSPEQKAEILARLASGNL
jgi:hypothetical protein